MARQISISDDLYQELSKMKGTKSFSLYIKERIGMGSSNRRILKFAGALKRDAKRLNELTKAIAKERAANKGRKFTW